MSMRSLNNLDIKIESEVTISDIIIPIKIDMGDITDTDYLIAISLVDSLKKESNMINLDPMFDFNKIDLKGENIILDNTELQYKSNKNENFFNKFINSEFVDGDIHDIDGISQEDLLRFKLIIAIWIDLMFYEYNKIIKELLELENEEQINYNSTMTILQACYEYNSNVYFEENIGLSFSQYSKREKILFQSYLTKNNMINLQRKILETPKVGDM